MSAADNQAYGNPNWHNSSQRPWGNPNWRGGPDMAGHWLFAAKPILLAAMILGFIFWWPVGMVFLVLLIASRRMAWGFCGGRAWRSGGTGPGASWGPGWKSWSGWHNAPPSSGNGAFDEYRAETLRRLEEEQKDFTEFLDRLRAAKDKAEFDQFMTERRERPESPQAPQS